MATFVATYAYTDDTATRDAVRAEHRAWLAGLDALLVSGPTDDGGAVLVFAGADARAVEALLDEDPFARAGTVIAERRVAGWDPVVGPLVEAFTRG